MISFIIIGKNEAKTLGRCIDSVFETIKTGKLANSEIIYIDSNSGDNSIEIAKQYNAIKILRLAGYCSPAIARNIGAREANKQILFFIDADTFLNPMFKGLSVLINQSKPFIFGYRPDIDSINNKTLKNFKRYSQAKSNPVTSMHGTFIIDNQLFGLNKGFNEKYKKAAGEDIDFSLRLKNKGVIANYIKEIIGYHYNVDYLRPTRAWKMLVNGSQLYARSVLYRDHLFNKKLWPLFLRREYSLLALLISLVVCVLMNSFFPLLLYAATVVFRILFQRNKKWFDIPNRLLYYPVRDVYVFLGMLFFFPQKPKNIKYEKIK